MLQTFIPRPVGVADTPRTAAHLPDGLTRVGESGRVNELDEMLESRKTYD